jgi:hypothetical protein
MHRVTAKRKKTEPSKIRAAGAACDLDECTARDWPKAKHKPSKFMQPGAANAAG